MIENVKQFLRSSENTYLFILVLVFVIAMVMTNPLGEMALNDDWFYYNALRNFHLHQFTLDPWITPSLMGQIFYAKIFTLVFGFSFSGVRFLTLCLAILSSCFLLKLLSKLGAEKSTAFLISLLWLGNPIFYNLSFTFMTDVPALSFVLIGFYFYFEGWYKDKDRYFFFAHILIMYASLIRQNYAVILPVFALVFLFQKRKKRDFFRFVMVALLPMAGFLFLYFVFKHLGWWPTTTFASHIFPDTKQLFSHASNELFSVWQYLALFLSPILVGWILQSSKMDKLISTLASIIALCIVMIHYVVTGKLFPYSGNILSVYGLGVRDPNGVLTGTPSLVINNFWVIMLTVLAGILSGVLVVALFRVVEKRKEHNKRGFFWFVGINFFVQLGIVLSIVSFDRYYLVLEFFLLLFLAPLLSKKGMSLALVLTILIMMFSVWGTFDYLSENRLKWSMAESLTQKGIKPNSIDAGYEWLGIHWYNFRDPNILPFYSPTRPWYTTKIFPDNTREYIISYNPQKSDYIFLERKSYPTLFRGTGFLYLLKYQPSR